VITKRINPIALIYPVFRPFEMVNDYAMHIIPDVHDNQVDLAINMVVDQVNFHLLRYRILRATK
jgi:hypothetical protein